MLIARKSSKNQLLGAIQKSSPTPLSSRWNPRNCGMHNTAKTANVIASWLLCRTWLKAKMPFILTIECMYYVTTLLGSWASVSDRAFLLPAPSPFFRLGSQVFCSKIIARPRPLFFSFFFFLFSVVSDGPLTACSFSNWKRRLKVHELYDQYVYYTHESTCFHLLRQ